MIRRLTQQKFHLLCNLLNKHAEKLMGEKPLLSKAARFLSQEAQFEISPRTLRNAMTITNITWEPDMPMGQPAVNKSKEAIKALEAKCSLMLGLVHNLYIEFGIKAPLGYTIPEPTSNHVAIVQKAHK